MTPTLLSTPPSSTPPPFRSGKKVYLRELFDGDASILTRWINDPEVTQYVLAYWPKGLKEEREWIASLNRKADRSDLTLGICLTSTDELIGTMGIHKIDYVNGFGTTGAMIGNPEHRSQGYGTEAKHLLLQYAFHTLGLRKICSELVVFNKASKAYGDKCGYREVGRRKTHLFRNGEFHDLILTEVFREEWEAKWKEWKGLQ